MIVDTDRLMSISNYALKIRKSRAWVQTLIKEGKLKSIKIDNFNFVVKQKRNRKR